MWVLLVYKLKSLDIDVGITGVQIKFNVEIIGNGYQLNLRVKIKAREFS